MADLVLPETSDLERYGYRGYASTAGGLVALRQPVVDPVGQARPVLEIEYELAQRMDLAGSYPWTTTQEWINFRLRPCEVTVEQLKAETVMYTTPGMEYRKYLRTGFATPSGKIELYSERLKSLGHDPLPVYVEPPESHVSRPELAADFPLVGTTRKPPMYVHTRFRNIPRLHKLQPEPLIRIHPLDAEARSIHEGETVEVSSPQGKIELRAVLSQETQPGQVVLDFGWGNPWDNGPNVHELIGDEAKDPISATTSNRRFLCQVSPIA
ncbi:MAG: molybdopterin dinucleotide binding domain-containing protein, partial [Dehalococcoidia bacterium]|nr:molybdopterin dinucleotide binding domain-containing protein [Dehalococcoidia bacterium]